MKKTFILIVAVIALLSVNAAAVSADSGTTVPLTGKGGIFVPLGHGVDH
ncbi:hypothetical protein [Paenibacillus sp. FSL R7-0331]|nr:hypothetical protein [Paenibacillus sp. FSL R7-0331]